MSEIMEIIEKHGLNGLIIVALIALSINFIRIIIENYAHRLSKTKLFFTNESSKDLTKDILLSNIRYFLDVQIPNLSFFPGKPVRDMIAKDLLRFSIESILEVTNDIIVEDGTFKNFTTHSVDVLSEINNKFILKCKSEGIPEIIIIKYNTWLTSRLDYLRTIAKELDSTQMRMSPTLKATTFLLVENFILSTIIGDAKETLSELNGEITGMIYKGREIEHYNRKSADREED